MLAHGHDELGEPVEGGWHVYPELATAGLWTTPTDLCRYALAVQAAFAGQPGALISQPLAREMLTPQVPASDRIGGLAALGLGPFVADDGRSSRFGHSGGNEGFRCHLLAYSDTGQGRGGHDEQRQRQTGSCSTRSPRSPTRTRGPAMSRTSSSPTGRTHRRCLPAPGPIGCADGFDFTIRPVGRGLEVAFAGQRPLMFGFVGRTDANALQFASMATDTVFRLADDDAGQTITFVQNGAEIVCARADSRARGETSGSETTDRSARPVALVPYIGLHPHDEPPAVVLGGRLVVHHAAARGGRGVGRFVSRRALRRVSSAITFAGRGCGACRAVTSVRCRCMSAPLCFVGYAATCRWPNRRSLRELVEANPRLPTELRPRTSRGQSPHHVSFRHVQGLSLDVSTNSTPGWARQGRTCGRR